MLYIHTILEATEALTIGALVLLSIGAMLLFGAAYLGRRIEQIERQGA